MKKSLPKFDRAEYARLLATLSANGYAFNTIGSIREEENLPVAYIRHDVDFFLEPQLDFARMEAEAGCRATYYFLLTGTYNLFLPENGRALREIRSLGHEVGLHYDLETYPLPESAARDKLAFEIRTLEELCGTEIKTISTHNPHKGGADPFKSLSDYVHPHDPEDTRELLYVSDSCRAWRDEELLRCLTHPVPQRLMLLTHPELWMDSSIEDRHVYFQRVILPAYQQPLEKLSDCVTEVWRKHAGVLAHDLREGRSH